MGALTILVPLQVRLESYGVQVLGTIIVSYPKKYQYVIESKRWWNTRESAVFEQVMC